MNRLTQLALAMVWFGVVFLVSFWMTFPQDAVKERIRYEVHNGSNGDYTLEMDSVSPWWVGLALGDVRLYTQGIDPTTGQRGDVLAFVASDVRVRSTIGSLMAQQPAVNGSVELLDGGTLSYEVETAMNKKGTRLELTRLVIEGPDLPIADLGASAGIVGTGSLDVSVDLDAPDGLRSAQGKIALGSSGLAITELGDMLPPLGFDIPVDSIDLVLDVDKGRAKVKKGDIESGFGNVEVEGELTLREDILRSTYRFTVVISDLSPPAGMEMLVESALSSAKWADDTYHYSCSGTLDRARGCVAQRERSSRTTSRSSSRATTTNRRTPPSGTTSAGAGTTNRGTTTPSSGNSRNSDEIRERIRQRREERERRQKEQELEELGYDEGDDYEDEEDLEYDEEEQFGEFFDDEVPIEELERAFEEAFE